MTAPATEAELRVLLQELLPPFLDADLQPDLLPRLVLLEEAVIALRLFSPNEELHEVPDEHLPYLLVPAMLAQGHENGSGIDRALQVAMAQKYLEAFIQLMQHYDCEKEPVFPKALLAYHKALKQPGMDPGKLREMLIANERARAALSKELTTERVLYGLQKQERSILLGTLTLCLYKAVRGLQTLSQERQILDFQRKLKGSEEERKLYEEEQAKPLPRLKYWKFEKPREEVEISGATQVKMCEPCRADVLQQSLGMARQHKLGEVFRMNPNQPTVTNDEVDQMEYENFMQREERNKKAKEAMKQDSDSDHEEVDDRKKKEARRWDDWKDDHEKGSGNRGNR